MAGFDLANARRLFAECDRVDGLTGREQSMAMTALVVRVKRLTDAQRDGVLDRAEVARVLREAEG